MFSYERRSQHVIGRRCDYHGGTLFLHSMTRREWVSYCAASFLFLFLFRFSSLSSFSLYFFYTRQALTLSLLPLDVVSCFRDTAEQAETVTRSVSRPSTVQRCGCFSHLRPAYRAEIHTQTTNYCFFIPYSPGNYFLYGRPIFHISCWSFLRLDVALRFLLLINTEYVVRRRVQLRMNGTARP